MSFTLKNAPTVLSWFLEGIKSAVILAFMYLAADLPELFKGHEG